MWLHNNLNTIKVQAYNEKVVIRNTGGLTKREDYDTINLKILIIPEFGRYRQKETGRFEELILHFQVSKSELNKKNFDIKMGKTHIIWNDINYKVIRIQDASFMPGVQLYDCFAKRIMPVENLI
jgi:hypothetical protein